MVSQRNSNIASCLPFLPFCEPSQWLTLVKCCESGKLAPYLCCFCPFICYIDIKWSLDPKCLSCLLFLFSCQTRVMSRSFATPWTSACIPPGPSVHGIFQGRILEWVTISFSRGSSWPTGWTQVFWIGRWATTEVPILCVVENLKRDLSNKI